MLLLHKIHFALVLWFFSPPKLFPQLHLFSSGAGVWVTRADSCSFKPTQTAAGLQPLAGETGAIATACFFFSFFFFSCLFALNTSCNSQLKEACQGKAKTNGVHCFDLLFSLEKGHGPILPDLLFFIICFCLYKQKLLFAQYNQLSFKKFMVPASSYQQY